MTDPTLALIEQQREFRYQQSLGHHVPVCEDSGLTEEDCRCPTCSPRLELRAAIRASRAAIRRVVNEANCGEGMRREWVEDLMADERRYRAELAELGG